jgi:hypothetical protein
VAERLTARLGAPLAAPWFDLALAGVLAAACLAELYVRPGMSSSALEPILVILMCAPVAARRRRPVVAICAAALVVLIGGRLARDFPDLSGLAAAILCYSCGAHASGRAAQALTRGSSDGNRLGERLVVLQPASVA